MVAVRGPAGLLSSASCAGMPHVGLQSLADASLPVSGQLHWGHRSLRTRLLGQSFQVLGPATLLGPWPGLGPAGTHLVLHAQLGPIEQQHLHGSVVAVPHSLV